jgi:hypothetical protein
MFKVQVESTVSVLPSFYTQTYYYAMHITEQKLLTIAYKTVHIPSPAT